MVCLLSRRAALGAAVVLLAARAAGAAQDAKVTISNFTFAPSLLTVPAGTRVTWTNADDIPHLVVSTASPPLFHSPPLDTDDSYAFVFDKPGRYDYYCALHPHMQGSVVVT
jgi:plastocyanin